MLKQREIPVAFVVTPHGYGHAARAAAVAEALCKKNKKIVPIFFTLTPQWFFKESLSSFFRYFSFESDVGFVQRDAMSIFWSASQQKLRAFAVNIEARAVQLAKHFIRNNVRMVVSDIAPLGLMAAREAALPSVLIENFTWSWIYDGYVRLRPWLKPFVEMMRDLESIAALRIQATPFAACKRNTKVVNPISREATSSKNKVRKFLKISAKEKLFLISMGGFSWRHQDFVFLKKFSHVQFAVMSQVKKIKREENIFFIPHRSSLYHPDLVAASDAVLGKAGYSTTAETFNAGIPFGIVGREGFRESKILENFVRNQKAGIIIAEAEFRKNIGEDKIDEILSCKKRNPSPSGASSAASIISEFLD